MQAPVIVMSMEILYFNSLNKKKKSVISFLKITDTNVEREVGRKAQISNITAAKVFIRRVVIETICIA